MCRHNQAVGLAIAAFFAGILLGACCEMGFGLFLIVVGGIILGLGLLKKK